MAIKRFDPAGPQSDHKHFAAVLMNKSFKNIMRLSSHTETKGLSIHTFCCSSKRVALHSVTTYAALNSPGSGAIPSGKRKGFSHSLQFIFFSDLIPDSHVAHPERTIKYSAVLSQVLQVLSPLQNGISHHSRCIMRTQRIA